MRPPKTGKPLMLAYATPEIGVPQTGSNATMASVAYPALALLAHGYAHWQITQGLKGHFSLAFIFVLSQFLPPTGIGCAIYALHTSNPNRQLSWIGLLFGLFTVLTTFLAFFGI